MNIEKSFIESGKAVLGIELGSTRIKAVLLGKNYTPIASGSYTWENKYENGIWTYSLDDAINGLGECYADLLTQVEEKFDTEITKLASIGISGMMHGYLPFDKHNNLLCPFRTWRNTTTAEAAKILTKEFDFNVPMRWSISHLHQAIINDEPHVRKIDYITTLSGYVHWVLTGQKVIGIGDASGMFPIDNTINDYNNAMIEKYDMLICEKNYSWKIRDILPKVLVAGQNAGMLTKEGAKILDKSGKLCSGIPMCPPEGDAATGMVATDSISLRTGNISAGTSIFAMIVLEKPLSRQYSEIDMVTTPCGNPVAMVHCNNCTSEIDAWVKIYKEFLTQLGVEKNLDEIYSTLYNCALNGEKDCGGVILYNFQSGEPIVGLNEGCPLLLRSTESNFNLSNLMRSQIYSTFASLRIGMRILDKENVHVDNIMGHGGLFKSKGIAQSFLAGALNTNVSVMKTAGEGGAYGIAVLAAFCIRKDKMEDLDLFLKKHIFSGMQIEICRPDKEIVSGFNRYLSMYEQYLPIEKSASKIKCIRDI